MFKKCQRLLATIYYLKWIQIWARLMFIVKTKVLKPLIIYKIKKRQYSYFFSSLKLILKPANAAVLESKSENNEFVFLNQKGRFKNKIQWNSHHFEKLWLYNLHYFEFLIPLAKSKSDKDFQIGKRVIWEWIQHNSIGYGNGWEPYSISLRIVNWIFFFASYARFFQEDSAFRHIFLTSLYQQACYLEYFLEFHILANHLFENIKSLFFAGIFFQSFKWTQKAWMLLEKEIDKQILEDGGHYECSPMYHILILNGVLDIINISRINKNEERDNGVKRLLKLSSLDCQKLKLVAEKMTIWLSRMLHPDGRIALFGDSAFNIAPSFLQIQQYYENILVDKPVFNNVATSFALKASGYFILRSDEQYLVIDGGKLGVRYQPGHAHCDLLSYEYSFQGVRYIIDSGVGNYQEGDLRKKARSIYSHNTVVVNQLEQAEIWKVFRVGRWVKPDAASLKLEKNNTIFEGRYQHSLTSQVTYNHQRKLRFIDQKFYIIEDLIQGAGLHSIESLIHFHPKCQFKLEKGFLTVHRNNQPIIILWSAKLIEVEMKGWFYTPEFGKLFETKKLLLKPKVANLNKLCYVISPIVHLKEAEKYLSLAS